MPRGKRSAVTRPPAAGLKRPKTEGPAGPLAGASTDAPAPPEANPEPATQLQKGPSKASSEGNGDNDNDNDDDNDDEDDDYDENADGDYDPLRKADVPSDDSEGSDPETQPDYSAIATEVSQVRTRGQRYQENAEMKTGTLHQGGLLEDTLRVDVDEIFQRLQELPADDWALMVLSEEQKPIAGEQKVTPVEPASSSSDGAGAGAGAGETIRIFSTYTFAGKLVREAKVVDANSAEAKAYMNSTSSLALRGQSAGPRKSYVTVVRKVAGSADEQQLRIKLKRPSLIDKFLLGDKQNKLTTLEKSRLDWASFVDKKRLKDDLAIHNKGGYLEKQDFLGRMEARRDTQYQQARELDRQRQWQQQQQQQQQLL